MAKVLKLLEDKKCDCNCIKRMINLKGENINGCEIFEKLLEENKEKN